MRQLGMLTSKTLNSPFEKIGSLCEREGKFHAGECLSRSLTWSSRDSFGDMARRPFSNDKPASGCNLGWASSPTYVKVRCALQLARRRKLLNVTEI